MNLSFKKIANEKLPFALSFARSVRSALRHRRSKRTIHRLLEGGSEILIDVGGGDIKGKDGWLTIDIANNCDLFWDLRKGLPFPDASVSKIYSSHFFEHLPFQDTQRFLQECKRALKPGGRFLVCVPNAKIYLDAYVSGRDLDPSQFFGYKPAYNHTTRIDYVNYVAYLSGEHHYMFDEENLLYILGASGFKNVKLRPFDPSCDLKERDFESIYAEAEK